MSSGPDPSDEPGQGRLADRLAALVGGVPARAPEGDGIAERVEQAVAAAKDATAAAEGARTAADAARDAAQRAGQDVAEQTEQLREATVALQETVGEVQETVGEVHPAVTAGRAEVEALAGRLAAVEVGLDALREEVAGVADSISATVEEAALALAETMVALLGARDGGVRPAGPPTVAGPPLGAEQAAEEPTFQEHSFEPALAPAVPPWGSPSAERPPTPVMPTAPGGRPSADPAPARRRGMFGRG